MTLSIITVNLNNLEGLRKTYDSIASQAFRDFEWVVVDGGSTDGSKQFIEAHAHSMAYWCSEPDKGIYNAMNKGIAHAKGSWLQFLNSGDYLHAPDTLQRVFDTPHEDADLLFGDTLLIYHEGGHVRYVEMHGRGSFNTLRQYCATVWYHQSMFYKRDIFSEMSYDESYRIAADTDLNTRLAMKGMRFKHLPIFISYFDTNGISHSPIGNSERKRTDGVVFEHVLRNGNEDPLLFYKMFHHRACFAILENTGKILTLTFKILEHLEAWRVRLRNALRRKEDGRRNETTAATGNGGRKA